MTGSARFLSQGATLTATLARIQDYDHHQDIYKPEVIGSKLIARRGDNFQIYLRVLKKKIITVVLPIPTTMLHYAQAGANPVDLPVVHNPDGGSG